MNRSSKSSRSAPVTWSDLVASRTEDSADTIASMEKDIDELPTLSETPLELTFAGCASVLARGFLFCGTAGTRRFLAGYHPHLVRLAKQLADDENGQKSMREILDFALLAECAGAPRPPLLGRDLLGPVIAARREFFDHQRRSLAFTALALGDAAAALVCIDATPATHDAPVLRFEFNQFELIRYLAAAVEQKRPTDWIEPAWVEYFELFPLHIEAEAAEWPDIFNFARILANVRGDKVSDIADDLHARVQMAAKQEP
jgi:hypothetical protein